MKISCIGRASAWRMLPLAIGLALGLAACGGGGGDMTTATTAPVPVAAAASAADSSGTITAFGSVFVNGHRFNTDRARVIDDDSGEVTMGAVGLEVGMVVDVKHDAASSAAAPIAAEMHVHPLARGYVDAADATAGTLTVMGQTIGLTSATTFSDHRACVSAATSPCTAITTATGIVPTTVSGTTTTPGSYVTVHGYLFDGGTGSADIVATLVSVRDAPAGSGIANFKVEGVVTVGTATVSIGALKLDLANAVCVAPGGRAACSSAFATGQVVAAAGRTAPAANTFAADLVRRVPRMPVETAGAAVEVEGAVASTGTSTFVVRGMSVDASGLPAGTAMPNMGDIVRVLGTIANAGKSVTATNMSIVHAANSVNLGLEGDASNVSAGTTTGTFTLSVLGQTITVNAQTRLADMSVRGWDRRDPAANPFNITTFQTYLAASTSRHVVIRAESDGTGLIARSFTIVPASSVVAVAGVVDATPAVVNSTVTGTPTTFSVHGIAVKADPAAIAAASRMRMKTFQTIAAGDQVVVVGTLSGSAVTVGPTLSPTNNVLDVGPLNSMHRDRGAF